MKNKYTTLCFVLLFALSCKDRRASESLNETKISYNFIILLDFSDRLLVSEQREVDKKTIAYIYTLFESKVKNNLFINSKDKFKIVIADQNNSPINPTRLSDALNFDISNIEDNGDKSHKLKKDYLINFKNRFI